MAPDPIDTLAAIDQLDVSFERREALTKAVQTGRIADLPWATLREPLELPEGLLIDDRYRLEERIGSGGFGGVFRCEDQLTSRTVAVKVLDHFAPWVSRRMLQEIAVLRRLDLPGVVGFLDEGDLDGRPYVVMPFMAGTPFPGTDHDGGWDALGPRILALAEAVARVHGAGVVHRDLKPDNVLWTDGRPVLIDFGLATAEQLVFEEDHDLAGSPAYLAPEQYLGDEPTEQSDLFSLGVLIYECLSGELPFAGTGALDVITQLLSKEPEPLAERCDAPRAVAKLVHRLLAKDPEDRPRSAAHVVRALRAVVPLPDGMPRVEDASQAEDFEPLFTGPEMLFQLRSDPAQVLFDRTGGDASVAAHSLACWVRAGVAKLEDGTLTLPRGVVDRMMAGMAVDPCRGDASLTGLDPELQRLWVVVDALEPWATVARLAAVLETDEEAVGEGLSALVQEGLVAFVSEAAGWRAVRTPQRPDGAHARRLHDLLLEHVPRDSSAYLRHLVQSGRMDEVPASSVRVARARHAEGQHLEAWVAAREGLTAERRLGQHGADTLVLATLLALEGNLSQELDVVALEARRRGQQDIERLCRFARALQRGEAHRNGLQGVDVSAFPELRDWPHVLMGYLLKWAELEDFQAWLEDVEPRIDPYEARFLRSVVEERLGNLHRSAELCDSAVRPGARGPKTASRRLMAATRWCLVGRLDRALAQLDAADEELRLIRSPRLTLNAQGMRRAWLYRSGRPVQPSAEWFEALQRLPRAATPNWLMLEAAIAWRAGAVELLPAYDERVQSVRDARLVSAWFMDALRAVVEQRPDETLVERAFHPDAHYYVRAQLCAAHAMAGGSVSDEVKRSVHSWLDGWDYPGETRMDLFSPNEIRRALEGA